VRRGEGRPIAVWKADKQAPRAAIEVAQDMGDTAKKQALDDRVAAHKSAVKTDWQIVTALATAPDRWNQETSQHRATGASSGSA
jgi:hypothetical protein